MVQHGVEDGSLRGGGSTVRTRLRPPARARSKATHPFLPLGPPLVSFPPPISAHLPAALGILPGFVQSTLLHGAAG